MVTNSDVQTEEAETQRRSSGDGKASTVRGGMARSSRGRVTKEQNEQGKSMILDQSEEKKKK